MKGGGVMKELLQTVLENPTVRGSQTITVAASGAAAEFAPWNNVA